MQVPFQCGAGTGSGVPRAAVGSHPAEGFEASPPAALKHVSVCQGQPTNSACLKRSILPSIAAASHTNADRRRPPYRKQWDSWRTDLSSDIAAVSFGRWLPVQANLQLLDTDVKKR